MIYYLIIGLISAILSIFLDWLGLLFMESFVFASITVGVCLERNFIGGKKEEKKEIFSPVGYAPLI